VASYNTTISQLTEQVSIIKNGKQIIDQFDQLASQEMGAFMTQQSHPTTQCCAGGHASESSNAT